MLSTLLLSAGIVLAAAPYPGSVKWFCGAFEEAEVKSRFAACVNPPHGGDKDVQGQYNAADHARQQCVELINSGVSQKRLTYDKDAAKKCLDAETARLKDPLRSHAHQDAVRSACATVTKGLVSSGGACESSLDCSAALVCVGAKGGPPGKCTARLPAGSACDEELLGGSHYYGAATAQRGLCAVGLHCTTSGELTCAPGTDQVDAPAPKKAGEACKANAECKGLCRSGKCAAACGSG